MDQTAQPGSNSLSFIDLFCGCGGFSLGMERAGFTCLAAIDNNPKAIAVFRDNFSHVPHALERDLTAFSAHELAMLIGTTHVDVIIGGPPCQGFSTARQRDGANHGERLIDDPRRHLYKEFLRYIAAFTPKVFIMENVLGIRSASNGEYFTRVQQEARQLGYRVHARIVEAYQLGVPQKRRRQLFIGTRMDLIAYFHGDLALPPRAVEHPTLGEAIGDLPPLEAGTGEQVQDYDPDLRSKHIAQYGSRYLSSVLEIEKATRLTAHCARPQNDRDLRDFARLQEGENSKEAIKRGVQFEFPYDKESFKDRYTRQSRSEPCSTIVAHMSKDGLMFIHPTQNRSLTPREAARAQGFPDWFQFPVSRMHQFRVIGNAVPPLVGESIGLAVKSYVEKAFRCSSSTSNPIPLNDEAQAMQYLNRLIEAAYKKQLRRVPADEFRLGWWSVGFLFPHLHPDGVFENGSEICNESEDQWLSDHVGTRLAKPCYLRSGWPTAVAPIVVEAHRRQQAGKLSMEDLYCENAAKAGLIHRASFSQTEVDHTHMG